MYVISSSVLLVNQPQYRMEAGQLWRQYVLAGCANFAIAISGFCMGWTSPVNLKLANVTTSPLDHVVSLDEEAWIGSLLTVGAIFGPFIGGFSATTIGRKLGLVSCSIPMITGWILIALTTDVAMIYAGRIFNGIGLGMIFTISPMYCAEIATDDARGAIGAFLQIFITLGFLIVYSIGPYVEYEIIAYVGIAFTGIFGILFMFVPESPMYYLSKDDVDSATDSLCKIRGRSREAVQSEIDKMSAAVKFSMEKKGTIGDIFRGGNFKAFYISCALIFFLQLCGVNAVLFYLTNIFEEAGSSLDSSISTIIIGAVQVAASTITPFVADKLGRRILMIISAIGTVVAHALLGTYFTLADNGNPIVESIDFIPIMALMLFIIAYCWGLGGLPYPMMAELLPMELKAVATTIITAFSWTLSFLVTRYFSTVADGAGMGATFFIFGSFCVLAFFFSLFLLPETKGKSYQEIQDMLSGKSKSEKP